MAKRRGQGEGSIYKRAPDGRWVGSVNLGYEGGTRRRRVVYGDSQAEVVAKLEGVRQDRCEGRLTAKADNRQTVGAFLRGWLDDYTAELADSTQESYRWLLERHVIPELGDHRLSQLTARHVQALLTSKQDLAPRTRQYLLTVLRSALDTAEREGLVPRNVAKLVKPPSVRAAEVRPYSAEEAAALLEAAAGTRMHPLIALAVFTGLRVGECLGLRWADIDLEDGAVSVKRTRRRTGTVADPKTEAGRRVVPMDAAAVEALAAWRTLQAQDRAAAASWEAGDSVFTTRDGRLLSHAGVRSGWRRTVDRAEVEYRGFHHLRKTYTSLLAAQGIHPKAAQQLLGHTDVRVTLEAYTRANAPMLRDAASAIGRALEKPAP